MVVTEMKRQFELNAENVTVYPYPMAYEKQHRNTETCFQHKIQRKRPQTKQKGRPNKSR